MKQCVSFLLWKGLIEPNEAFFSPTPHVNAPWCIAAWIMNQQVTNFKQISKVTIPDFVLDVTNSVSMGRKNPPQKFEILTPMLRRCAHP